MPVLIKPLITIDGNLSDWIPSERIDYGDVPGYSLYAQAQGDNFYFALTGSVAIGANTTFWFNTDLNAATGFQIFGFAGGAEYNVNIKSDGSAALYTGAAGQTLVLDNIQLAYSADHQSIEFALPKTALGNPAAIDTLYDVNDSVFGPANYSAQPYVAVNDGVTRTPTHRIAIVYSDTSANLYFNQTAYSDLFMAAQNQARMAGVSYDVIDESQLSDINNLVGYDALVFPSMADVNTAQMPAIMSTLTSAVYQYHIGIITSGDFLTNDQTGAALPGNSYANMQTLLNLARYTGGNSGAVTVTANDVSNPIMHGYAAGQVIQSYASEGYAAYQSLGTPADVLVNQNVGGVALPGVVETTTGGTNVHFATTDLLGDSNLLSNAIQSVVLGTQPGVALHMSRDAGVVAVRMDMDQSQFPADVSPVDATGNPLPGIYDTLIPILQQWNQQYNFVGSYYINIGDNPTAADPSTTVWAKNLPYYQAIQAMGSEIGTHSYTHLINPPTTTVTETTVGDTPVGSTQITLSGLPSFAGVTVGMFVSGGGLGTNTPLPGAAGEGGSVANTQVTAVSGNTITISYVPNGFGGVNDGTIADLPAGTTLTFSIPAENTNFLQTGTVGAVTGSVGDPFTYDYEFNQSKLLEQQQLGTTIYGAAIPGANETFATDQNILPYFQSVAATATTPGYTGYLTGGWTGIGSGYPSAIGYMSPTDQGSVYIAPNMTFDFTEIQYQGKTVAQAEADWAAQFNALAANAAGTPVVVLPVHDYGVAAWNTTTDSATGSPYTTQMYTDFIAQAYAKNYEFLTLEELAARTAAQQKAGINYTTVGNTITATVTPDPTAPDVGGMALGVVNGGTEVIQNVTNWYAYNATELFLPTHGGTFTINLGTTQDAVTHIASLPMRGDLLSVTGNGLNLSFSMLGAGDVVIDLGQVGNRTPIVTGATIASLVGNQLDVKLTGLGENDVSLLFAAPPPAEVVSTVAFLVDTGSSATDFVTSVAAQTILGTLSGGLAAGDVVKVSLDNGATWLTATAATGDITFSLSGVTLTGGGTLIARVENADGLASAAFSHAYVLDQVPPGETAAIVAMTDDSGVAGDFVTNNGAVGRTVSGTLSAALATDETLQISSDGGATWVAATTTGTSWSAPDIAGHAANWTIEAQVVDLAGNLGSLASQAVTFDITPPAAPTVPDLADASDSGVSNTDNLTNITSPTFTGTAEAGSTVTLFDGATAVGTAIAGSSGTWTVTTSPILANGTHSITATATDVAGNISAASGALPVTIDTIPPAIPSAPDLIAASDSGRSSTDNITSVTTPTFKGTAVAGSAVTLFDGTTTIGTGVATAAGAWTIVSSTLANGVHSITANAADAAGNLSAASTALAVTIETAIAAPSVPDMVANTDKGVSNTDNITNDATPNFTGTAAVASTVTLFDGTTVIGTGRANAAGVYTITASTLVDGTHSITASAVGAAGDISIASAALSVIIDTSVPAAPSAPDLIAASDSGVSNTDNITNDTTPTFTGTVEAGATVTLFNGAAKVGTAVATTTGDWTITTSALGNGVHSMTTKATDVAGNVSVASAALSVTIDAKAPATPSRPDLITASDSGVSNTDNITKVTTPTFTGTAEAASTVTLTDGTTVIGTDFATAAGTWSITTTTLADGVHSITAKAADASGNISAASNALSVTVDTLPPGAATFTGGAATSLNGRGEAGDAVTVFSGTTSLGTATVGTAGNWNLAFIAGASVRTLTAVQSDKAGNLSPTSGLALVGTSTADTLTSTAGNEFMVGAAGADTFVFGAAFGNDVIADFAAAGTAHDIINFQGSSVLNTFGNVLSHTTQVGTGSVISLDFTNTLTLNNVSKTNLTSADFTFV